MQKKRHHLALFVILLTMAVSACNGKESDLEDQVATAVAQTLEAAPSATVPRISGTPTNTPRAEQPASSPEPIDTPTKLPTVIEDLREELYFASGAEGTWDPCLDSLPSSGMDLPAIGGAYRGGNYGGLCLFGFPLGEKISVDLYAPDGEHFSSQVGPVWQELEGITTINVRMGWPVGLLTGEWFVVADSPSAHVEGPFEVVPHDGPALSAVSGTSITPFWSQGRSFAVGEQVTVLGANFEPNRNIPLGIYYKTGLTEDMMSEVWSLVHSRLVTTDSSGNFSTMIRIEPSDVPGVYVVVTTVLDPVSTHNLFEQEITSYSVVDRPSSSECPLQTGTRIQVRDDTRTWDQPNVINAELITSLPTGAYVYILSGPKWGRVRQDIDYSGWWWEISDTQNGDSMGWIWEGRIEECDY